MKQILSKNATGLGQEHGESNNETMKPRLLAAFVFLHELGHIVDYEKNYPTLQTKSETRTDQLKSLPYPNANPSRLAKDLANSNSELSQFLSSPDGINWLANNYQGSIDNFKHDHEMKYHLTPMESAADVFAVTVLMRLKPNGSSHTP